MEGSVRPSAGMKEVVRLCWEHWEGPTEGQVIEWGLTQGPRGSGVVQAEEWLCTSPRVLSKLQTAMMAIM